MRYLKAFGERIAARDPDHQATEFQIRFALMKGFSALSPELLTFAAPAALRRRGVETRLVVGVEKEATDPDLRQALVEACARAAALKAGASITHLAAEARASDTRLRRHLPLAFLSPSIKGAILDGTLASDVTLEHLVTAARLSDWEEQERKLSDPCLGTISLERAEDLCSVG